MNDDRDGKWSLRLQPLTRFGNPSAADDQIVLIKHHGLPRRNGPLWLVERDAHFAVRSVFQHGGRRLMPMADLGVDAQTLRESWSAGALACEASLVRRRSRG